MRAGLSCLLAVLLLSTSVAHADGPRAGQTARRHHRVEPPCLTSRVSMSRVEPNGRREPHVFALTHCDGTPNVAVLDELSLLARGRGTELPTRAALRRFARDVRRHQADENFVFTDAMRLDPGLLLRVQAIATHFPGRAIEVISGFRPRERDASRHRHGRALDLRVVGISRERLRDFARTLPETGVGYYPNSVFVHVDVRDRKAYWVDRAGPGEAADYGTWPPTAEERGAALRAILDSIDAALLTSP